MLIWIRGTANRRPSCIESQLLGFSLVRSFAAPRRKVLANEEWSVSIVIYHMIRYRLDQDPDGGGGEGMVFLCMEMRICLVVIATFVGAEIGNNNGEFLGICSKHGRRLG